LPLNDCEALVTLRGVQDSKLLSPEFREEMRHRIESVALAIGVGQASEALIDEMGLTFANRHAMLRAVADLTVEPDALVIDYLTLPAYPLPQISMPRADTCSISVAAASIVAKTLRDRWMIEFGRLHPDYGFEYHKGYGTARHRSALARHGPCSLHRRSFQPVAAHVK
jgi:ribonuclease HII